MTDTIHTGTIHTGTVQTGTVHTGTVHTGGDTGTVAAGAHAGLGDRAGLPDVADVLAETWRERMGSQPPADWLAHTTQTLNGYLAQQLAHARAMHADALAQATQSERDELTRLRTMLRQQLAALVSDGLLDLDTANTLLHGQPPLYRTYTVHIKVPFTVRVSADNDDNAYHAAVDAVADALIVDGDEIDGIWADVDPDGVDPGDIDITAP